jgi:hypothetical protein
MRLIVFGEKIHISSKARSNQVGGETTLISFFVLRSESMVIRTLIDRFLLHLHKKKGVGVALRSNKIITQVGRGSQIPIIERYPTVQNIFFGTDYKAAVKRGFIFTNN